MDMQIMNYIYKYSNGFVFSMSKKLRIILIEDDADDVELLQDALNTHSVPYTMTVLKDGSAAANFCETAEFLPDIIIMDFNLPRLHGREVVKLIRCKNKFANVPILILSTSSSKEDIAYAYKAGADKYLIKPATLESIRDTVRTIIQLAEKNLVSS
jgi:DNA-binding response OmpR family regulator